MVVDYDVVIAGAGPAGAECARYLSEHSKYKVLLLDRTQEIGEPKKSTAGTVSETMRIFKLPGKVAMCRINKIVFESPSEKTVFSFDGFVLDFWKLKKFLVERAVHHGVDVKIESNVTKPVVEKGGVVGVQYSDLDGVHAVKAKIVIDATGPAAVLACRLGLRKLDSRTHYAGVEFEMEKLQLKHQNAMLLRFDQALAPGGYSWIFSTGKNHGKVGVCMKAGRILPYLEKWIKSDDRLSKGIPLEMHAGDAFVCSVKKMSADNFMVVGDAACTVHPFFGEGIRSAMYSGMFAAQTAIKALKSNDFSAGALVEYDNKWREYSKTWKWAYYLNSILYRLPNKGLDLFVRRIGKIDSSTRKRFVDVKFTLNDVRKLLF